MTGFQHAMSRQIVRHSTLVIGIALLGGFALGWSLVPESGPIQVGGTTRGWVATHVGGMLNGVMALVFALVLDRVALPDKLRQWSGLCLIFAIWSNTVFYWAGNFAPNRGLTLTGNNLGEGTLLGVIAFLPAAIAAVAIFVPLYAIWVGTRSTI
jgi:styrene-oxide isomerase